MFIEYLNETAGILKFFEDKTQKLLILNGSDGCWVDNSSAWLHDTIKTNTFCYLDE